MVRDRPRSWPDSSRQRRRGWILGLNKSLFHFKLARSDFMEASGFRLLDNRKTPAVVGHTGPHRHELNSIHPFGQGLYAQFSTVPTTRFCVPDCLLVSTILHLLLHSPASPTWSLRHVSSLPWELALPGGPHAGVRVAGPAEPPPQPCPQRLPDLLSHPQKG